MPAGLVNSSTPTKQRERPRPETSSKLRVRTQVQSGLMAKPTTSWRASAALTQCSNMHPRERLWKTFIKLAGECL